MPTTFTGTRAAAIGLRKFMEFCLDKLVEHLREMINRLYHVRDITTVKIIMKFLGSQQQIRYFRKERGTKDEFYRYWCQLQELDLRGVLNDDLHKQGKVEEIKTILIHIQKARMYDYDEKDYVCAKEHEEIEITKYRLWYGPYEDFRSFGVFMDRCMQTLMHHIGEKLADPSSVLKQPEDKQKFNQDDAIYCLIQMLPKQPQFIYYRTNYLTHDQFMVHWSVIKRLHSRGQYSGYRLNNGQVLEMKEAFEAIREARLWGYEKMDHELTRPELKEVCGITKLIEFV